MREYLPLLRTLCTILILLGMGLAETAIAETKALALIAGPPEDFDELPTPDPNESNFQLLFMGNSHSASNDLPGLVTRLIRTNRPDAETYDALAPGYGFLADRLSDGVSGSFLRSRQWSHVILQAQKYSSTGRYTYPTAAAEEWIRRATSQDARPILFPEWPRRGNTEEGQRVHNLHLEIASREAACVAPVGLAWEQALADIPGIDLHAPDGNHANLKGSLLTAYVLYQVITGQPASELSNLPDIGVSTDLQTELKAVASHTVNQNPESCAVVDEQVMWGIPTLHHWGVLTMSLALAGLGIRKLARGA